MTTLRYPDWDRWLDITPEERDEIDRVGRMMRVASFTPRERRENALAASLKGHRLLAQVWQWHRSNPAWTP